MNKVLVLGIVFILLFTINLTLNNSHASLTPVYQWPITITNHQNISTPNPFQQLIKLNIQSLNQQLVASKIDASIIFNVVQYTYSNGGITSKGIFANFEFSYLNGQVIPAWIQGNYSGILFIWLKLPSIPASGSITIYLDIFSSNTNLLSSSGTYGIGENPSFSLIYGEYDDGASVFDFYDNFVGNSLNGNNWVYGGSGSIIVNDSAYLETVSYIYIMTKQGFNPKTTIADVFAGQGTGTATAYVSFSMTIGQENISDGYFWLQNPYHVYGYGNYSKGVFFTGNGSGFITGNVESESWQSNNHHVYILDYGFNTGYNNQTFDYYSTPSLIYYGIGLVDVSNGYVNVTWFDVRAFPPYGIMPSVYFNPILTVSVSYPSGNSSQTTNNSVIYPQYNATSEDLQFDSQYFSFIIDPLFIFSLLTFLSLIFVIFMAIAIVRKRR